MTCSTILAHFLSSQAHQSFQVKLSSSFFWILDHQPFPCNSSPSLVAPSRHDWSSVNFLEQLLWIPQELHRGTSELVQAFREVRKQRTSCGHTLVSRLVMCQPCRGADFVVSGRYCLDSNCLESCNVSPFPRPSIAIIPQQIAPLCQPTSVGQSGRRGTAERRGWKLHDRSCQPPPRVSSTHYSVTLFSVS